MRSILTLLALTSAVVAAQQHQETPAPPGQDIAAQDGDRIIIDHDARIQVVRRREATIRTIFIDQRRLLIVLIDNAKPGRLPDGVVDDAINFYEIEGDWPLGPRWESFTAMLQYEGRQRARTVVRRCREATTRISRAS